MRSKLLQQVISALEDRDFNILVYLSSTLDIAAQRKRLNLLIKVLENIDGLRPEQADSLKTLAASLNASPVIIGETTKTQRMKDDAVYDRHGINAMTVATLASSLDGVFPPAAYSQGRLVAEIDGNALRRAREAQGLSLQQLADELKLSKESIYFYEHEKMRVKYDIAKRVEHFLDEGLTTPVQPFVAVEQKAKVPAQPLGRKLFLMDFDVYSFDKLNFDMIAKDEKDRVVIKKDMPRDPERIAQFSDFFNSFLAVVAEKENESLPVIHAGELEEIKSKKEFIKLLKEKV